jgi:hypothetical protein
MHFSNHQTHHVIFLFSQILSIEMSSIICFGLANIILMVFLIDWTLIFSWSYWQSLATKPRILPGKTDWRSRCRSNRVFPRHEPIPKNLNVPDCCLDRVKMQTLFCPLYWPKRRQSSFQWLLTTFLNRRTIDDLCVKLRCSTGHRGLELTFEVKCSSL